MKNILIVTGGAGFIGSNLIDYLLKKTKYKIISLDNYSSGSKKNHIKNKRVTYLKGNTKISKNYSINIKVKPSPFFILQSLLGSIRVLKNLMSAMTLIL